MLGSARYGGAAKLEAEGLGRSTDRGHRRAGVRPGDAAVGAAVALARRLMWAWAHAAGLARPATRSAAEAEVTAVC